MLSMFVTGDLFTYLRVLWLGTLVLSGCAVSPLPEEPVEAYRNAPSHVIACARFFQELDQRVALGDAVDAEYARINGFPYLRINRFLASYRDEVTRDVEFAAWVDRLMALDRQTRLKEMSNLSQTSLTREKVPPFDSNKLFQEIEDCGNLLRDRDLADGRLQKLLPTRALVPSEYQFYKRVLGLYPITGQFVLLGVARLHEETSATFAEAEHGLPVTGKIVTYVPRAPDTRVAEQDVGSIIAGSINNPLGIPEPGDDQLAYLFRLFAPILEIDTLSDADRIGRPFWGRAAHPEIDVAGPQLYYRTSYTRLQGRVLLQLNYQLWFPARPHTGRFDILAGHLDGITWRVTLAMDGTPLLYEAVHNCGCYHMYFPTSRLKYRGKSYQFEEPLFIPRRAPNSMVGGRMVLRITHTSHYLQSVSISGAQRGGIAYGLTDYHALRSLPLPNSGHRSMYGQDGIVPGTERGERWLLWPMGVPEPGAMRQWGHHATAFVGRRHFDDPDLVERYFQLIE